MRAFVALNVPSPLRDSLFRSVAPLRGLGLPVRWVDPGSLHLTLKFLGAVPDGRLAELHAALQVSVQGARPVTLAIEGFGAFPDLRRPSVVWAGVANDPAVELLQHAVEMAFAPLGFPPEGRPFRPHVTLGRASRDARPAQFAGLAGALEALTWSGTAVISSVDLMRSTTGPGGAVYEELGHGRLS